MSKTLIFIDTETTGLDPRWHYIWDLAYIIREPGRAWQDVEWQHFFDVDLETADPYALRIGQYWTRKPAQSSPTPNSMILNRIMRDFDGAILVGACPWFDANMLEATIRRAGGVPTWDHHLIDVETLAAGKRGLKPGWTFKSVLEAYGLEYPCEADRHTALGDARMARDLFDVVMADA